MMHQPHDKVKFTYRFNVENSNPKITTEMASGRFQSEHINN